MSFEWNEDLTTGVAEIDNQHKEIFGQLNVLLYAMDNGKGRVEIDQVLEFLEDYVATHFRDEESFMSEHSYDGLPLQIIEHSRFIKDFYQLKKELSQCGNTLHMVVKVEQTLGNWLINHIKIADKEMAIALKRPSPHKSRRHRRHYLTDNQVSLDIL